ncbi:MAG TPA: deaminase domain-containing protein [Chitinophaga sp.]|uniref:deaminase domain-containing protein n=1 Tax=Chitinophaga sp. TaxID=1869181 RepID=UPI002DBBEF1A|nr:deaminase domain-containing protein [Chitinophaga sp.]HEU4553797.1 deaminase domain-containing protein [Chitinophaga sp.]
MKRLYYIIIFIIGLAGSPHAGYATGNDSIIDAKATAISEQLMARMEANEQLIREGKGDQASYLVLDDQPPASFFRYFTSEEARKLWIKRGFLSELILQEDISVHMNQMNEWINELRKTYLENTAYKDYKIYFVISGIYNYDNVEAKAPDIDWSEKRSISYNNNIKPSGQQGFSDAEKLLLGKILQKVKNRPDNKPLVTAMQKEKYIICFLFNLYRYFPGVHTRFVQGSELSSTGIKVVKISVPNTFMISGYFYSPQITSNFIQSLSAYSVNHMNNSVGDAPQDITSRNDFLAQHIRNVYLYFSTLTGNDLATVDCEKDDKLRDRLEQLYKNPMPNAITSIAASLNDLSVATRKCLLNQLSQATVCGDADNWILRINACENIIMDVLKSTPPEQKRQLMDYLNDNNDVLRGLINRIHDEGGGNESYTAFVNLVSQYAYDVYNNDLSAIKADASFCSWLSYNPETDFNDYSKDVIVDYYDKNDLYFQFRNYTGLCSEQVFNADGSIGYAAKKFHAKPFDFIGIIPQTDLPFKFTLDNQAKSTLGQKIFVPAIMLYWNIHKTGTFNIKKDAMIAVNVAGFFMGGTTWLATGSALAKVFTAAEGVTTLGNVIANTPDIKQRILSKEGGQELLSTIDNINAIAGVSNLSYLTLARLNRAVKLWRVYETDRLLASAPNFEVVSTRMNQLEQAMVKDGLVYTKGWVVKAAGVIDDAIAAAAPYLDELKALGVSVRKMTQAEADALAAIKSSNNIRDEVNIAKAEVTLKNGESYTSHAASGYPDPKAKNILTNPPGAAHPKKGNSIFEKYTFKAGGTLRLNDTEVKLLEEFALKHGVVPGRLADPVLTNVEGNIKLYTQLCPCASCTKVIKAFRTIFPNVNIEIVTTPIRSFK